MAFDMQKMQRMATGMARTQNVMKTAEGIRDDYKETMEGLNDEALAEALPAVHLRSAQKLLSIAKNYGGIYNKAAQFAASLRGPIPKEYTDVLSEATDRAPFKPFAEMDQRFRQEFRCSAKELFAEIEEEPMAAASLAQVHRAKLKDGRTVAVKVQYPGLVEQIEADLEVIEAMLKMFADKLPFDMGWLLSDFRGYLRKEVNFCEEADNARLVKKHFAFHDRVFVPQPIDEFCNATVLTLEFAEGCRRVNDLQWLQQNGIDPLQVADILNVVSGNMVFVTGFIHGDPHAGNVYVRTHPELGGPQLVVLDHGLYHRLDDDTRVSLCKLWQACYLGDAETKQKMCEKFAGPMAHFFPLLLSQWFMDNLTLQEASDLAAGKYYQNVDLNALVQFLAGMEEQKTILGMLHSTGYTRFLLQDLSYPEHRRLEVMSRYVLAGLDESVAKVIRGEKDPQGLVRLQQFESEVSRALRWMQVRIRWFAFCFVVATHRRWVVVAVAILVPLAVAAAYAFRG
eukprot:EG_transcript_8194